MNILIDIRPLMDGKLSGVEMYILRLLGELFRIDKKNNYFLFANSAGKFTGKLPAYGNKNVTIVKTSIPNKILNFGLRFFRYPKLDKMVLKKTGKKEERIDIFFMPDFRPSALSKKVKKITTIHDLSFVHFKKFFSNKTRLWYRIMNPRHEAKTSDHIIAVSSFTKQDVVKTYGIPAERISVIYEGIDEEFCEKLDENKFTDIRRRYGLPSKYYLFLSTIEPRKNIQNMVKGFIIYKRLNPRDDAKLVIAGQKNKKIFSAVMHDPHPDIVFTGFIEEEDKAQVMKHASVFLYPSFFEGFGLPLLEAMKCGTPTITSDTSSMPEVAGEAALLVNPHFPDAIAAALEKIQESEIRERLKKNMEKQISKFSWEDCAKKTLEVFEKVNSQR